MREIQTNAQESTGETPEEFIEDLADYEQAGVLLDMKPASIPVAISKGHLPLTRFKRGRKTYLSKREIVNHIKRCALPAPSFGLGDRGI